tara:strand:+ start:4700 stop:5602 length:903 start_codon:yes stop_codon:yes gene_type:complete
MKTKLLLGALILITIGMVFMLVAAFKNNPQQGSLNLFQQNFLSAISQQVTGNLALTQIKSPAQVSLEDLGEISPVAGMVTIVQDVLTIRESDLEYEYIEIRANKRNAQPINISNWSIQSMVSDSWVSIPQGTRTYTAGVVNDIADIYLNPGESAIIATKVSPIGVSFRENSCSGFLGSTQKFVPALRSSCIDPQSVLTPTIDTIKKYGDACIAFVENMRACTYASSDMPGVENLSDACLEYIQPLFTYNGCVDRLGETDSFYDGKKWRIFLGQSERLWKDNYEVIRLLDEDKRTVDVFNY